MCGRRLRAASIPKCLRSRSDRREALEKDADARYQDAGELARDLHRSLSELDEHPGHTEDNTIRMDTKTIHSQKDAANTLRLDTENTKTGAVAATTSAIDSSTRLRLSRRFDSSYALQRIAAPAAHDRAPLSRSPQPLSTLGCGATLANVCFFCSVAAAALVGIVIAFA